MPRRLMKFRVSLRGPFVAAEAAREFVETMEREYPDELREWLREHAVSFVTQSLVGQVNAERSRKLHNAAASEFAVAARAHRDGDSSRLREIATLDMMFVVDKARTRKRLGDMVGAECRFAAGGYERKAQRELAVAAFLAAVAKKAGRQRVGDVLDDAKVERMLRSFGLGAASGELPHAA